MLLSRATDSVPSGNLSALDELAAKRAKLQATILLPLLPFHCFITREPLVKNPIKLATTVVAVVRIQHASTLEF